MGLSFTVFMTKGAYVVNEADAERVLEALDAGSAHVAVTADIFGDGLRSQPMRIVTAHVVSVATNVEESTSVLAKTPLSVLRGGLT